MSTMQGLMVAYVLSCAPLAAAFEQRTFVVEPTKSVVTVHVGKAGIFKFAGHEHQIVATKLSGLVVADAERIDKSSVIVSFETRGLIVSEAGEPTGDAAKVQQKMVGSDVLDVIRFPAIDFRSRRVSATAKEPGTYDLEITGDLALHGVTRSLTVRVRVEIKGDELIATGRASFKQRDFGLEPVSVAGVVKVKDELEISYKIVARASHQATQSGRTDRKH